MTREEARDQIVIFMADEHEVINDRDRQALEMAVKALEQEPCKDCISRQAVIDALYDWSNHSMTDAETWHIRQVIGDIKSNDFKAKEPKTDVLDKIRAGIESRLQGVNIALEMIVKDDALIPRIEAAKTTLEEVLEIIDKAIKDEQEPKMESEG